jgi:hypothetical protein
MNKTVSHQTFRATLLGRGYSVPEVKGTMKEAGA